MSVLQGIVLVLHVVAISYWHMAGFNIHCVILIYV